MENLSLDILDEILRLAGPYDLLSLARTSKPFWTHLRSKTCRPVWKHVYEYTSSAHEVPRDHPDWLDSITFTSLLYETRCSFCEVSKSTTKMRMLLPIGKQTCTDCFVKENFVTSSQVRKELGASLATLAPCMMSGFRTDGASRSDANHNGHRERRNTVALYDGDEYAKVKAILLLKAVDPDARNAARQKAAADVSRREKISSAWSKWLQAERVARRQDVERRLGALSGMPYRRELEFLHQGVHRPPIPEMQQFWDHPFLVAPQSICAAEWARALPLFTSILDALRPKRWRYERWAALLRIAKLHCGTHGAPASQATATKYLEHPDVQALLTRHGPAAGGPEADLLAKFGVQVEAETQLDFERAYPVIARVWWDSRMPRCTLADCEWAKRGIEHAGELDEKSAIAAAIQDEAKC